jgi:putative oxidoreductase
VILAGTWSEFILPALILVGFFTRLAAIGMIGFVIVQSMTDIVGHGAATGSWFDNLSDGVILDQRALWVLLFVVLVVKGAGPLSLDRVLGGRAEPALA